MSPEATFEVTLQNLRAIIHGLKMASFSFVEEKALSEINSMIKSLPGPETINTLDPGDVKSLQNSVGKIMRLVELYGKRDMEYKTRYKSRTGLPPRYKVLDWRCAMEQKARDITRNMIKTSAVADELGYGDIADRLIRCAKKVQSNEVSPVDLAKITADTLDRIGFSEEALQIRKVAQGSQVIELGVDDLMQGFQRMYQVVDDVLGDINRKVDTLKQIPTAKKAVQLLSTLWQSIQSFKGSIGEPFESFKQQAPAIEQALEGAVPQSVFDANEKKNYKVEWSEPDAQGEETAFVTKQDGKQYEVQRESNGRMVIAPTPMAAVTPATQETAQQGQETAQQGQVPAGQGGGVTTSPNLSNVDNNVINSIFRYIGVAASSENTWYKEAMSVAVPPEIPPEIVQYIQSIKGNEAAMAEFVKQLKARQQQLSGSSGASPQDVMQQALQGQQGTAPAQPAPAQPAPAQENLMNPEIGTSKSYGGNVFNLKKHSARK